MSERYKLLRRLNIQEYDFSEGAENNVTDAMSRCLLNSELDNDSTYTHRTTVLQYRSGTVLIWDKISKMPDAW